MDTDFDDVIDLTPDTSGKEIDLPTAFTETGDRYLNAPRYFTFRDYSDGIFGMKNIAIRITEDDKVALTFIETIDRRVYTHTRNRRVWTGPWVKVTLFDMGDFPVGPEWDAVRMNRICSTAQRRHLVEKHFANAYDLVSRVGAARGPYKYNNC